MRREEYACPNGCSLPPRKKQLREYSNGIYGFDFYDFTFCPCCGSLMPYSLKKLKGFFEVYKQTGEIKRAPLIAINDLKNESQRNEQDGIRYMLMGFFQGPRNLYQHNHIGSGVSNSISVIIERFIKRCPSVLIAGDRYAY